MKALPGESLERGHAILDQENGQVQEGWHWDGNWWIPGMCENLKKKQISDRNFENELVIGKFFLKNNKQMFFLKEIVTNSGGKSCA